MNSSKLACLLIVSFALILSAIPSNTFAAASGGGGSGQRACKNNADCSDGNKCNGTEICRALKCAAGRAINTEDNNACTIDSCDAASGAKHTNAVDGTSCGKDMVCKSGVCSTKPAAATQQTATAATASQNQPPPPPAPPAQTGQGAGGGKSNQTATTQTGFAATAQNSGRQARSQNQFQAAGAATTAGRGGRETSSGSVIDWLSNAVKETRQTLGLDVTATVTGRVNLVSELFPASTVPSADPGILTGIEQQEANHIINTYNEDKQTVAGLQSKFDTILNEVFSEAARKNADNLKKDNPDSEVFIVGSLNKDPQRNTSHLFYLKKGESKRYFTSDFRGNKYVELNNDNPLINPDSLIFYIDAKAGNWTPKLLNLGVGREESVKLLWRAVARNSINLDLTKGTEFLGTIEKSTVAQYRVMYLSHLEELKSQMDQISASSDSDISNMLIGRSNIPADQLRLLGNAVRMNIKEAKKFTDLRRDIFNAVYSRIKSSYAKTDRFVRVPMLFTEKHGGIQFPLPIFKGKSGSKFVIADLAYGMSFEGKSYTEAMNKFIARYNYLGSGYLRYSLGGEKVSAVDGKIDYKELIQSLVGIRKAYAEFESAQQATLDPGGGGNSVDRALAGILIAIANPAAGALYFILLNYENLNQAADNISAAAADPEVNVSINDIATIGVGLLGAAAGGVSAVTSATNAAAVLAVSISGQGSDIIDLGQTTVDAWDVIVVEGDKTSTLAKAGAGLATLAQVAQLWG